MRPADRQVAKCGRARRRFDHRVVLPPPLTVNFVPFVKQHNLRWLRFSEDARFDLDTVLTLNRQPENQCLAQIESASAEMK
ncbi:MAG: hypothetical protein C0183_15405 [Roseiflexus castenholzii]|nr:MAG: hypothetical protein C0183_15405 [Roseiflexus castenholzii]